MDDTRKIDRVTDMLSKYPKAINDSFALGFKSILNAAKDEYQKERSIKNTQYAEDTKQRNVWRAVDQASAMQGMIKTRMSLSQVVGKSIGNEFGRIGNFIERTSSKYEAVKNDFAKYSKQMSKDLKEGTWNTVKDQMLGILQTFTGPFFGLFRMHKNVGTERVKTRSTVNAGTSKDSKSLVSTGDLISTDLARIVDLLTELNAKNAEYNTSKGDKLPTPKVTYSSGRDSYELISLMSNTSLKFTEFVEEQFLISNDFLNKIYKKSGGGSGEGRGLLGTATDLASLAIMSKIGGKAGSVLKNTKVFSTVGKGVSSLGKVGGIIKDSKVVSTMGIGLSKVGSTIKGSKAVSTVGKSLAEMTNISKLAPSLLKFSGSMSALLPSVLKTGASSAKFLGPLSAFAGIALDFKGFKKSVTTLTEAAAGNKEQASGELSSAILNVAGIPFSEYLGKKFDKIGSTIGTSIFDMTDYIKNKTDSFLPSGLSIKDVILSVIPGGGLVKAISKILPGAKMGGLVGKEGAVNVHKGEMILPAEISSIISRVSSKFGVREGLISRVVHAESGGKVSARSPKGAQGLMQLMPKTAKGLGVTNPLDPEQNITGGVKHLSYLLNKYKGDESKALAAYNWGQGNVDRKGLGKMPKETRDYLTKILGNIPGAAVGGLLKKGGLAELHPAEIVTPIDKFIDMVVKSATAIAKPEIKAISKGKDASLSSSVKPIADRALNPDITANVDPKIVSYLASISTGIDKLISVYSVKDTTDTKSNTNSNVKATPVPDFPGDPGLIFGGNYFPQKGRQWR